MRWDYAQKYLSEGKWWGYSGVTCAMLTGGYMTSMFIRVGWYHMILEAETARVRWHDPTSNLLGFVYDAPNVNVQGRQLLHVSVPKLLSLVWIRCSSLPCRIAVCEATPITLCGCHSVCSSYSSLLYILSDSKTTQLGGVVFSRHRRCHQRIVAQAVQISVFIIVKSQLLQGRYCKWFTSFTNKQWINGRFRCTSEN